MTQKLVDAGEVRPLQARMIRQETCVKYGYSVGKYNGKPVQIAPYYDKEGRLCAQHLRFPNKDFIWLGDSKAACLFGQHLWRDAGKRIVITEGEIDCLTISQLQGNKWPVVSLPSGAQGGRKALANQLQWLEQYEEIILCFDMDEPGQKAAKECATLFSPGKVKIAHLPLKDANDMLKAGKGQELIAALWEAKEYRPDGIIGIAEIIEEVRKPVEPGVPWPWPSLTKATYGRRPQEVYGFGAGTGVGKTDVFTQIIAQTVTELGERCGVIYLEQPPTETVKRIAGKIAQRRFHIPESGWSHEELDATLSGLLQTDLIRLYSHFGVTDWDIVRAHIRHMVLGFGAKHIFLDHLTALATGGEGRDEKEELERIMADIASMAQEMNFTLYYISHLTTPEGKPHEEGGRVMIRHFKGSRAIGFWSHYMFGLERNQQAEEETERRTTILRILKDRYTGTSVGVTIPLWYEEDTGMLVESADKDDPFGSSTPSGADDVPF